MDSTYVMISYDVTDQAGYEPYVPKVLPLLERHGAEVLAADFDAEALEGTPAGVNVILRFPNAQSARAWYNDTDYAPVRDIRLRSSVAGRITMVKPFGSEPTADA